ncbi:hypothetical protein AB0C52_35800 [Streptomyces sp. NPDC048717]|uniref:hypothetical protein n=1 Tax=Streptomyces sp. NPDC048717 TaxID=3154928 RepID=UPI003445A6F6
MTWPENIELIPDRDPASDNAVDWDRVRASIKALRPVRALFVLGLAPFPALLWAERVAVPVTRNLGADGAFATAFMTSALCAIGMATGGRIRRWVLGALLVAAVGGTLIADPTRHLVATLIVGA